MSAFRLLLTVALGALSASPSLAATDPPTPKEILEHLPGRKGGDGGSLEAWMQKREVPGVSIAVIRDFQIDWTWVAGTRAWGEAALVDAETLFQAASISKSVSAAASHVLAEQGKLDLDAPMETLLKGWTIPPYDFPESVKITPRLLLAHRAGTDRSGFEGYAVGSPLPTLTQILTGEAPANSGPVTVAWAPGTAFHYSGGGITAVQLMLGDVTGKPAEEMVRELVLTPLGMTRSYFSQPLAEELRGNFAAAHIKDGTQVEGGFHVYPELFAAGLWTTPTDLCKFGLAVQEGLRGKEGGPISPAVAKAMTTQLGDVPTSPGFFIDGNYFFHAGGNTGMRCLLKAHKSAGYGLAIMTNSDRGQEVLNLVFVAIAKAYGWEY